jgi:anthranilate phosphoribosyltransferase
MHFPTLLNQLLLRHDLSFDRMHELMQAIMTGELSPAQIAAILTALRAKGETMTEIAAAAQVMRSLSTKVPLDDLPDLVDTCGTGGDGTRTFNISTASAFVAAAAGVKVAKHGGRSVSSTSGSADVLEAFGVNIHLTPEQVGQSVRQIGIGFMFAPNHHNAMKYAAPVRKELGVQTLFNILGPLTNPTGARQQVIGVYQPSLTSLVAQALKQLGSRHALVVHGANGLDELSISGESAVAELKAGEVHEYHITPEQFGLQRSDLGCLQVNGIEEAKHLFRAALTNTHRAASDIVALNAGAAIYVAGIAEHLTEGVDLAKRQIESGAAWDKLEQLQHHSQHA